MGSYLMRRHPPYMRAGIGPGIIRPVL